MTSNNENYPHVLTEKESSRFWIKINKDGPISLIKNVPGKCWVWPGSKFKDGYGCFYLRRRTVRSHRLAYILVKGAISSDLDLDHLCKNRACSNPEHMEPVTHLENVRRGDSGINNRVKIFCSRGHELVEPNLVNSAKLGKRNCLSCHRARNKYNNSKTRKGIILDPKLFQQVADEYYKEMRNV